MNKDVLIKVNVIQTDLDNNSEEVEFVTEAKFCKKLDVYYISYNESQLTGMEGTKTTIKISENTVNIIRFGEITSNLKFQEGNSFTSKYKTTYGIFDMMINSKIVKINIDDNGGEIYINYEICINDEKIGENAFNLSIK